MIGAAPGGAQRTALVNGGTHSEFDTDEGVDRLDGSLEELASTSCALRREALASFLAAGLHRSMMVSESILFGSLLHSTAGFAAPGGAIGHAHPEVLEREVVYTGYLTVEKLRIRLADEAVVWREIERHGDAVTVLPYDVLRRCALIVRLFRAPVFAVTTAAALEEACAGMIGRETEESAGRREAYEELGVRLHAMERVARIWTSPGVSTERQSLFLAPYALSDRCGKGGGVIGEHEGITVIERPLADLARDADQGLIEDGKLLMLVMALRSRRPELFAGSLAVEHALCH
jgi:nudix-type nucleoside diphosphatase (YffH/AdpP family)